MTNEDAVPSTSSGVSFDEFHKNRGRKSTPQVISRKVYPRLRDAILSAELHPNSRLVEDELAEWLQVSRTPIREALMMLETEGLVERKHGWLVREQNLEEVRERLECRIAVEGYAASLAAGKISQAALKELWEIDDVMEKPGISQLEYFQLNDHFHKIITDSAYNSTLSNLHNQTKINFWNLDVPVIFSPEANRLNHHFHHEIITALAAGDGEKAEALVRDHIKMTLKIVVDAINSGSDNLFYADKKNDQSKG